MICIFCFFLELQYPFFFYLIILLLKYEFFEFFVFNIHIITLILFNHFFILETKIRLIVEYCRYHIYLYKIKYPYIDKILVLIPFLLIRNFISNNRSIKSMNNFIFQFIKKILLNKLFLSKYLFLDFGKYFL